MCVCLWVHVCAWIHVACVFVCGRWEANLWAHSPLFCWDRISHWLGACWVGEARCLTSEPQGCSCFCPQHWSFKQVLPCPAFPQRFWGLTKIRSSCCAASLSCTESPPQTHGPFRDWILLHLNLWEIFSKQYFLENHSLKYQPLLLWLLLIFSSYFFEFHNCTRCHNCCHYIEQ